jgi:UDP-N-acetylglucosamine--N-acetylmuramyl-(pentapeptide) pyrophosphoryl-undecaprenol N-acetylglucosamine transferase
MRVVFTGGGTGGHVYPALTVAAALRGAHPEAELLYIGVKGKIDRELVAREGIDFLDVTAAPLRVGNPVGTLRGLSKLAAGTFESYSLLGRLRPDVVFATGGYGSVGVGLAARLRRLPLLVFLPDVAAGFAVKTLARIADRIAVTVEPALSVMPAAKTALTGYPVRPAFFAAQRAAARSQLGLDASLPTLLVTGGSTGASAINAAVAEWAPRLLPSMQLFHISGRIDHAWLAESRERLPADLQARYHLHDYLHEDMALALAAADLAVMRAGASTLGELPATRLPAVLIPGDFSDQSVNARYLESEGAAVMLPQSRLADLPAVVSSLLDDEPGRRRMQDALARLSKPDAAEQLVRLIETMAGARERVPA